MRKTLALLLIGMLALLAAMPAVSQSKNYPKDAYVKTAHIVAIGIHPLGYRLTYLKSNNTWGHLYVPLSWFGSEGDVIAKADMAWGNGPEYPYFSIFWVDGNFDHISIRAIESYHDPSWLVLDPNMDLSAQFGLKEPPKDF
jgi:hypothetical protein